MLVTAIWIRSGWRWRGAICPGAGCRRRCFCPWDPGAVCDALSSWRIRPAADGRRRFDPTFDYVPALDRLSGLSRPRSGGEVRSGNRFRCAAGPGISGRGRTGVVGGLGARACLWSPRLAEPGILPCGGARPGRADHRCGSGRIRRGAGRSLDRRSRRRGGAGGPVRQYATRHGLWQLDPHIACLSGDRLPAGVRGFEVLSRNYSENRLRRALAANGAVRARSWCAVDVGTRTGCAADCG